ncbi:MAG: valine--tRNA ligase [Candidatus Symbiothrix sp.]|jgi:valyl-tRNA synthetase|nr:valine--tRNA ligase [Candidatus Symbiothrix sp.]
MEIASNYSPNEVETKWYQYWMEKGFFHSEPDEREPYTIVIPPPNVTGVLHMGHMLNNTIQDILVRRARMLGKNACWVPGTDHASIATEAKVVAKLAQEGIKKTDLTREQFLEHVWEWTHKHGGIILEQLKKLGASCDWERTCFTMDEKRSESVIKVFIDLYNKGLIYRGVRMVNWDPAAKTALSDEEVIHKEQSGKLYYLRYMICDGGIAGEIAGRSPQRNDAQQYAVIATTRPETIFGDTAVCINPNDPRNAHLKGKKVIVPIVNREVPIIEDDYVDLEFGTGCLKVTPAHDVNDYMLGEKYGLEILDIFNDDGTLNAHGLQYEGKDRFEVRKQIEKDLEAAGLMEKVETYENKVGFSERTNVPIEPKLSMQWFLKMAPLATPALDAVMDDTIQFYPPKFKNTYRHWMENIKDWNISRQLWWGHRIPAYYLPQGGFVVAYTKEEAYKKALSMVNYQLSIEDLRQDEDTLDTWFSSWLWPISVFDGINEPHNKEIDYYYPTNDLVTAPEIIFFWVARMIMAGYEYRQQPCFKNVYFTGIVRDKLGRKMSKSLGNSPDPIELMTKYGADGVRMGMLLSSPAGNDLPFDESLCEQGRNFNNKIWNAFRLVKGWSPPTPLRGASDASPAEDNTKAPLRGVGGLQPESAKIAVRWFEHKLSQTIESINDQFDKYRISEALMEVYKLFWDEFSSWYLEMVKPAYGQPIDTKTYEATLEFFDALLRLLHPFMPFITEELWHALAERKDGESIMVSPAPRTPLRGASDSPLEGGGEDFKEIISNIRTVRLQKNIPNKDSLELQVLGDYNADYNPVILKMANLSAITKVAEKTPNAVSFLVKTTEFAIPLGNTLNVEEELERLQKELAHHQGFLKSVTAKLSNENFVAKAPAQVLELERKKQADAKSKIKSIEEAMAAYRDGK